MIFDTHAHYDAEQFDADRDAVLSALPESGVGLVLDPGCEAPSSRLAAELSERYPHVYAAVGWHPEEWESWDRTSLPLLRDLIRRPRVVAVGEIGLDYYWDKEHKALQREMFERQICLALGHGLPVIVHDREAHEDCLETVLCYPELRGVFHCFSGSAEMAKELLRRGWYLGFDGPVTYKNNRKAAEVLAVTPLDRILVETDSPYMAPEPVRGRRNDSRNLPYILARIAGLKGVTAEEMERVTWDNGCRLFGIEA
ncbi:MAG: TatD family hydrolase [Oscillospiraceae bacterium]|nr:TatD family hydrolase [Oscillospiraceae bacterium]